MSNKAYFIGLMSGTSADGIDLALVDFSGTKPLLVQSFFSAYKDDLHHRITELYEPGSNEIDTAFHLDKELAAHFSQAVHTFLEQQGLDANDIVAIGNHGQTIRHRPKSATEAFPYTLQIGCNQTLACLTGIDVIGQFRHKDIALGGQGAPLVPAFHRQLFDEQTTDTYIVNIGGIANITYLPYSASKQVLGFDTGPGNGLMDAWCSKHQQARYDQGGQWAASGKLLPNLLDQLLSDSYFKRSLPKSTGREYFNLAWLDSYLNPSFQACDVQHTLTQLTATSIANDIKQLSEQGQVLLCGGGVHNATLRKMLELQLPHFTLADIADHGIESDSLEAMAFAWLAFAYKKNIHSNMPSVTGASKSTTLGVLFKP